VTRRRDRAAITLIEGLFGALLAFIVVAMAWWLFSSSARGQQQLDRVTARIQALSLLRECLSWDLARSVSPEAGGVLQAAGHTATITVTEAAPGQRERQRPVSYRFDREQGRLTRDGAALPLGRLEDCRITPLPGGTGQLEVLVAGGDVGVPARLVIPLGIAARPQEGWTVDGALVPVAAGTSAPPSPAR
jgi:hypothetical protein